MTYLEEYNDIMKRYRDGEFGTECLSMAEILKRANNSDLLKKLSLDELQCLIDSSSGITKEMFVKLKENIG